MDKLKAGVLVTPHNEGMSFYRDSDTVRVTEGETEFYLKPEADEVIKKLNERVSAERSAKVNYKISANDLSDGLRDAYREIRHHKYRRCLNNAWWILREEFFAEDCRDERWVNWAIRWYKRWMELADKFKEEE